MKQKIAFICVHNSCRSQMAEALGKKYLSDVYDCYSAGTMTKPQINPDAVRLMKELYDIDMSDYYSKTFDEIPEPDIIISMGCEVVCPRAFDQNWHLEDPTGKGDDVFKKVIAQIEENIILLKEKHIG